MINNLLLATLLFHITYSTVHRVIPDDGYDHCNSTTRTSNLQYYLNNTRRYFNSHDQLWFEQGHHYLCTEWLLQDVSDFRIIGNNSTLSCIKPSLGIAIVNTTNVTIINLHINYCSKYWNYSTNQKHKGMHIPILRNSSIFIYHSANIVFANISITINRPCTSGILGINIIAKNLSNYSFTNITVLMLSESNVNNFISGITFYYDDNNFLNIMQTKIIICRFVYKTRGLCNNSSALKLIMMHKKYNVTILVKNSRFTGLSNSSVLSYYAESCRNAYMRSILIFFGCKMNNNKGNKFTNMFLIEIHSHNSIFHDIIRPSHLCSKLANYIAFINCDFVGNAKMNSLIFFLLKQNEQLNVLIRINKSNICLNNELRFINTDSELKLLKTISYTIIIDATNVSSNLCATKNRLSLITVTSGILKLKNSVIANNSIFENIIKLHSSLLKFEGFTNFSRNYARFILRGTEGSYYVHTEFSTVNINNNFVYTMSRTSKLTKEIVFG